MRPSKDNSVETTKKKHVRPRFVLLAIIGVFVAALMVLGARWYGENQAKKNADKEIQALQEQVALLQKKVAVSESDDSAVSDDTQEYLTIDEWGVRFPLTAAVSDAVYVISGDSAYLSTQKIMQSSPNCDITADEDAVNNRGAIGAVVRTDPNADDPISQQPITEEQNGITIGKYFYYYQGSQSTCGENNEAAEDAVYRAFNAQVPKIESVK